MVAAVCPVVLGSIPNPAPYNPKLKIQCYRVEHLKKAILVFYTN